MTQHSPKFQQFDSDPLADSMYFLLTDKPISYSVEMALDMIVDIAEDDSVVGIDIQHVTAILKQQALEDPTSGVVGPTGFAVPRLQLVG